MGRAYEVRKAAMGKTGVAKSKLYSKYGKEILIAAKSGVPDPEVNLALKRVIEKAKSAQVPTDIINRAIEKAKSKDVENYDEVIYEGFGPGTSTLIIECLTDNLNRTIGDIKTCFNKAHSKLGVNGSVSFNYKHCSVVSLIGATQDQLLEVLFEKNIPFNDIEQDEDIISVYGEPNNLFEIKNGIEEAFNEHIEIKEYVNTWIANETVKLNEEQEVFERLIQMLEEVDDVQEVYHNVEM